MHPMFVTLFLDTDEDDLLADEEKRRRRRARRNRSSKVSRIAPSGRGRGLHPHRPVVQA